MPVLRSRRDSGIWVPNRFGIPAAPPAPAPSRDDLVAGAYRPGPTTTGLYSIPDADLVDRTPASGNYVTFDTPKTYTGLRIWGQVRAVAGVVLEQCHIVGPDPNSFGSDGAGLIQNYGSSPAKFTVKDCLLDPAPWVTVKGRAYLNPKTIGLHGGNITLLRCEIAHVHDGVEWIGPSGAAAAAVQKTVIQQNWIHAGLYFNDVYPPNDGQPHADGIQTMYGRNLEVVGNYIGGQRDVTGYNIWPTDRPAHPLGANTGDDFWNSGLMLKQETSTDDIHRIRNVLVANNWITGGTASINHAYDSTNPNDWSEGIVIRDNKIGRRGANWGKKMKGDGPGQPGYDYSEANGSGYYILRNSKFAASYSGNVFADTGAPVPITNG